MTPLAEAAMSTCQGIQQSIVALVDGEATPPERQRVQDHLAFCAECQQFLIACQQQSARLAP